LWRLIIFVQSILEHRLALVMVDRVTIHLHRFHLSSQCW